MGLTLVILRYFESLALQKKRVTLLLIGSNESAGIVDTSPPGKHSIIERNL